MLIPPAKNNWGQTEQQQEPSAARQAFRKKLREGQLDDKEIEIDLAKIMMALNSGLLRISDDQPAAVHVPEPGRPEAKST
ncbi:Heat shock protein [Escherichia coli]|nr:Heat shock protein [Escherichia coli]